MAHDFLTMIGDAVGALISVSGARLSALLLTPGSTGSLGALAIVLAIAVIVTVSGRRRARDLSPKVILRAIFPRRLVRSRSGRADIYWFLSNCLLWPLLVGWAILSATGIEHLARSALTDVFGAREAMALPAWGAALAMTLTAYLAYELAYWLDHFLMHRVSFLWAIHKVHHSAESLSPLTNYRVHPLETVIFYNILAVTIGTSEALLNTALGHATPQVTIAGTNVLIFTTQVLLSHLQHSHIWISFTGPLGRVLLSPAHHQIHHSTNPEHFDRNFGSTLALFDRLFGTLYVPPASREKLAFGVDDLTYDPHSISGGLISPLGESLAEIRAKRPGVAPPAQIFLEH